MMLKNLDQIMKALGFTGRGVYASFLKISLILLLTYLEYKKYMGGAPLQIPKKICTQEYVRDFVPKSAFSTVIPPMVYFLLHQQL